MKSIASRLAPSLAAVAALWLLAACEPKPSNPPKPSTDVPSPVEPRPVDLRLMT